MSHGDVPRDDNGQPLSEGRLNLSPETLAEIDETIPDNRRDNGNARVISMTYDLVKHYGVEERKARKFLLACFLMGRRGEY